MEYQFAEYRVDDERYRLLRGDQEVPIQPLALRLLLLLAQRHPATVSSREMRNVLWPDAHVSDDAMRRVVSVLRKALAGGRGGDSVLQTVRGRGYRIGVDVRRIDKRAPSNVDDDSAEQADPLIGRRDLLDLLQETLAAAERGQARAILLAGEPGIGKTRAARELAVRAQRSGHEVLWGRSLEEKGAPALWSWSQVLRQAVRSRDDQELRALVGSNAAALALLAPEIAERIPCGETARESSRDAARFQLFDAVAEFIRRQAQTRPQTILLDDLHRADAASQHLLIHVLSQLQAVPVVVLGTYRDVATSANADLEEMVVDVERLSSGKIVYSLERLAEAEIDTLARIHADGPLSAADLAAIRERSGGNPLFVRELAQWMTASSGRRHRSSPTSVRRMIQVRLAEVAPITREMLEMASVLGRRGRIALLAHATGRSELEILSAIDDAERAGILRASPEDPDDYEFVHAIVMEAVYEILPRSAAASLHRAVAETIELVHAGTLDSHLASLAHHYSRSRGADGLAKAIEYGIAAAARAERQLAFEDALEHYRRAVHLMDEQGATDATRRAEISIEIARLEEWSGDRDAQVAASLEAIEIARRIDRADLFAHAVLVHGASGLVFGRVDETAVSLHEEALERLGDSDRALRARLLAALAGQLSFGDRSRRRTLLDEAIGIAHQVDDVRLSFEVSVKDAPMHEWLGLAEERLRLARAVGEEATFHALLNRGTVRLFRGEVVPFERDFASAAALATRIGGWRAGYWPTMGQAARAILQGRLDDGQALAATAFEMARSSKPESLSSYAMQMHAIRLHRGTLRVAREMIEEVALNHDPFVRAFLTRMYVAADDRVSAARSFEQLARDDFEDVPTMPVFAAEHWEYAWPSTMCLAADACAYLGDELRGSRLYELMLPKAGFHAVTGDYASSYLGPIDLRLGRLATLLGEHASAEAHLDVARDWAAQAGARPWLAEILVAWVELRLARRSPDDAERAAADAGLARRLAREIGMAGIERDLEALGLPA